MFTFNQSECKTASPVFLRAKQPCVVHKVKNILVGNQHSKHNVMQSIGLALCLAIYLCCQSLNRLNFTLRIKEVFPVANTLHHSFLDLSYHFNILANVQMDELNTNFQL